MFTSKQVYNFMLPRCPITAPKLSVCHQNPIFVIYRPVPHSDVVIKHSRIHDNITVPEWCGWRTALLTQSALALNTSQTGTSPLRTIQCISLCILHTCFKMINKSWGISKTRFVSCRSLKWLLFGQLGSRPSHSKSKTTMCPFLDMQKVERSKKVVKIKL